jgi:hypothetical protein
MSSRAGGGCEGLEVYNTKPMHPCFIKLNHRAMENVLYLLLFS